MLLFLIGIGKAIHINDAVTKKYHYTKITPTVAPGHWLSQCISHYLHVANNAQPEIPFSRQIILSSCDVDEMIYVKVCGEMGYC